MTDLVTRFPTVAWVLLAGHQDTIGQANARWLELRLEHHDWRQQDRGRLAEMMPTSLGWLLHVARDEDGDE